MRVCARLGLKVVAVEQRRVLGMVLQAAEVQPKLLSACSKRALQQGQLRKLYKQSSGYSEQDVQACGPRVSNKKRADHSECCYTIHNTKAARIAAVYLQRSLSRQSRPVRLSVGS